MPTEIEESGYRQPVRDKAQDGGPVEAMNAERMGGGSD
jgi:hypothetical protein